jgi:hypothetical protein
MCNAAPGPERSGCRRIGSMEPGAMHARGKRNYFSPVRARSGKLELTLGSAYTGVAVRQER